MSVESVGKSCAILERPVPAMGTIMYCALVATVLASAS